MKFEFLKSNDYQKYINLIKASFGLEGSIENLEKLDSNTRILVLKDNDNLVCTSMIRYIYDPIMDKKKLYIDYVCVSNNYQNQGIGRRIMEEVERIALSEGIDKLELTSNSKRCYAQKLYKAFGMEIRDTNFFEKHIKKDNKS